MMGTQQRQQKTSKSTIAGVNKYNPTQPSSKAKSYTSDEWKLKCLLDQKLKNNIK